MGTAGYTTLIKKSGTSTAMTDEAMTNTTGNTWQITASTKQVFDRDIEPSFEDNGVPIVSGDITEIDYLFGTVTFTGVKTGPITVSGNYMPLASVVGANDFSINITPDILECTTYPDTNTNGGYLVKKYGLLQATVSISRFDDLSKSFHTILSGREKLVIEGSFAGGSSICRGWYVHESIEDSADVAGLLTEDLSFILDSGDDAINKKTFSWIEP